MFTAQGMRRRTDDQLSARVDIALSLLQVPIPPSQIHAIDESQPSPAAAAQAYESVLKECVGSGAIEQASGESTIWLNHCAVVRQRGVKLMMPTFPGNSDSSGHSYFSRRISPRLSFLPPSHKLLSRTRCFFMHFFFALFAVRSMQVPHIPPSISFFLASDRMATWPLSSPPTRFCWNQPHG